MKPLVKGGQGRSAESVTKSVSLTLTCLGLALMVVLISLILGGCVHIGVANNMPVLKGTNQELKTCQDE